MASPEGSRTTCIHFYEHLKLLYSLYSFHSSISFLTFLASFIFSPSPIRAQLYLLRLSLILSCSKSILSSSLAFRKRRSRAFSFGVWPVDWTARSFSVLQYGHRRSVNIYIWDFFRPDNLSLQNLNRLSLLMRGSLRSLTARNPEDI